MVDFDVASAMNLPIPDTIEQAVRERNSWINTAASYSRNADYYRGLLINIGEMIGVRAYTQDDGNVTDTVLCAKIPEIIEGLLHIERRYNLGLSCKDYGNGTK